MNIKGMSSVIKTEVRGAFLSLIALTFIGVFLVVSLFVFFTQARFFARGIADVRPLFEWMPVLLISLTSAVSMRAWSEESRSGTLELLLTLPVRTSTLVLSKFIAALTLVAFALLCTLPLVWMVSELGMLDSGPVWGGYVATLALASAYLALGLCVSALTDHQVIALLVSATLCTGLYLIGSEAVIGLIGTEWSDLLLALGTGARFESIERGVLDLRDLAYFASLTAGALYWNVIALERKRAEVGAFTTSPRWRALVLMGVLLVGNLVLGNAHLARSSSGRIDLTAEGQFSVSDVTRDLLRSLGEPARITGYFSPTQDPQLNALIPQIRDMLAEYQTLGRDRVTVRALDPRGDEALVERLKSKYKIEPRVMNTRGRARVTSSAVYFHILVEYGDTHKTLSARELIDVTATPNGSEVHLKSLEYQLSRALKQLSESFRSLDSLLAGESIRLTAYVNEPSHLALELGALSALPEHLRAVFTDLKARADASEGSVEFNFVDPARLSDSERAQITANLGIEPFTSIKKNRYWLSVIAEVGERREHIDLRQVESTREAVRALIESGLQRGATRFEKTLGVLTAPHSAEHPNLPYQMKRPDPKIDYRFLFKTLKADLKVEELKLEDALIPSHIDALLLARVGKLTPNQRFAIDQFLMRGGAVVALANPYRVVFEQSEFRFKDEELPRDLVTLLSAYGVDIGPGYALDTEALEIIQSVRKSVGFKNTQMRYPYFVHRARDQFRAPDHLALRGLNSLSLFWPAPVGLRAPTSPEVRGEVLLTTSAEGWIDRKRNLTPWATPPPEPDRHGEIGLIATLSGALPSAFSSDLKGQSERGTLYAELARTGRVLKSGTAKTRLAVVGSSELVSDFLLFDPGLGPYYKRQYNLLSDYEGGVTLTRNLVEWATADHELVSLRKGSPASRVLKLLSDTERARWERFCYLCALALVGLMSALALISRHRRATRWSIPRGDRT